MVVVPTSHDVTVSYGSTHGRGARPRPLGARGARADRPHPTSPRLRLSGLAAGPGRRRSAARGPAWDPGAPGGRAGRLRAPWPPSTPCSRPTTCAGRCPTSSTPVPAGPSAGRSPASPTPPRIVVARDMRASGEELSSAFAAGARAAGTTVVDIGLASTDMLYFASGRLDAPGAMFTASHNPAGLQRHQAVPGRRPARRPGHRPGRDAGEAEEALRSGADQGGEVGGIEQQDLLDDYASHVRSFVDVSALRPLRVVADTANGMGGLVVPAVFSGLPFEVEILFPELDGTFPNHPADPIQPENLVDLKTAVLTQRCRRRTGLRRRRRPGLPGRRAGRDGVGFAHDGAGGPGRCSRKHPGSTILYNLICSKVVPETIDASRRARRCAPGSDTPSSSR